MSILTDISENLQRGKAKIVKELVQQAIDEGIPVQQILDEGLLSGMGVIGEKFKNNEVFVPEVLVAARAMNMGAQLLKPLMADAGVEAAGKVCIGTVKGDLHDIGKNLVKMMMEGKGLEVVDLHQASPSLTSSTDTRCGTLAIMPRTSGRSGRVLDLPMRPRPSARMVPRCLGFEPIVDLIWVTLRSDMVTSPLRS